MSSSNTEQLSEIETQWVGVGRAVGGAVIFSLPLLMTMEMWWLGMYVQPLRLLTLILASLPVFTGVSVVIGFRNTRNIVENIIDVFVAYAFGFAISAIVLFTFAALGADHEPWLILNTIMLLAVPASLGALLARSELGRGEHSRHEEKGYGDEIIVLAVGALFLAFNVAPTEEVVLIAYQMTPWHTLILFLLTVVVMHIFVVGSSLSPECRDISFERQGSLFIRYTCVAYAVAAVISTFMLWVFERSDNMHPTQLLATAVVLVFPAGVGAAASRLII